MTSKMLGLIHGVWQKSAQVGLKQAGQGNYKFQIGRARLRAKQAELYFFDAVSYNPLLYDIKGIAWLSIFFILGV